MTDCDYVPILQARRGELKALEELPGAVCGQFTPLLEIPPPTGTLEKHLSDLPAKLKKSWQERPFFLDIPDHDGSTMLIHGRHPLVVLCDGLRREGMCPIPVTAPHKDADYKAAVKAVVAADGRGACVRVNGSELSKAAVLARSEMQYLGLTMAQIDFLLDLGPVTATNAPVAAMALQSILTSGNQVNGPWRSLIVASGAFPESMAGLSRGVHTLPRADWSLWLQVRASLAGTGIRMPTFGDYGIQSPAWTPPLDPRLMRASANIRYTADTEWVVLRGRIVLGKGRVPMTEYARLCQALRARPEYRGPKFSPGDQYVEDSATGKIKPGTPEISRRQGTSHHLALVVDQLSSLPASSAPSARPRAARPVRKPPSGAPTTPRAAST